MQQTESKKRIIVALTSYPSRLWAVPKALGSIYSQTMQPDKVVLYLSLEQFPGQMSDVSAELSSLVKVGKLDIRFRTGDLRPHKKYIYAFREFPSDLIVTIDDDLFYPADMIRTLYNSWEQYPDCVQASRTHMMWIGEDQVFPYTDWLMEVDANLGKPDFQTYATTGAGTLYDPSLFKEYLYDEEAIKKTCLDADDMWMKANEIISGIPVVNTSDFVWLDYIPGTQGKESLYKNNTPDIQIKQWEAISEWFDEQTGRKNILLETLKHPPIGSCMTELPQYMEYFREQHFKSRKTIDKERKTARTLKEELDRTKRELDRMKEEYASMRGSVSYKAGRVITFPLRYLRDSLRRKKQ